MQQQRRQPRAQSKWQQVHLQAQMQQEQQGQGSRLRLVLWAVRLSCRR